jgi:hypothetical protein
MIKRISYKKIIPVLFFLIIGGFLFPIHTYAQTGTCVITDTKSGIPNTIKTDEAQCKDNKGVFTPDGGDGMAVKTADDDPSFWVNFFFKPIIGTSASLWLKLLSFVTGLAGVLLNVVISFTVLHMAEHYSGLKGGIDTSWRVVRDIANMGFIFMLLYASIKTIIGQGGDTKRLIISMVIAALLVNFSLFFTKIIIDISNLISLTLYATIAPGAATSGDVWSYGLSNTFTNLLHITSIYQDSTNNTNIIDIGGIITIGLLGSVMLIATSFVFLAVAMLFVVRYLVLIFVLILSPIVFVGSVLPGLNQYRSQWIKALTGQALFPPIYFLLTWISLTVLSGATESLVGSNTTSASVQGLAMSNGAIQDNNGAIMIILNFIMVIGFLIGSLILAKKTSASSGSGISKITDKITGYAGSATFGLAGRAGRGTVGRIGQAIADNDRLRAAAPNSRLARLTLAAGNKTAGASFDLRGTAIGSNLKAGKATKGGFTADIKNKVEAEKKYADNAFKVNEITAAQAKEDKEAIKNNTATPEQKKRLEKQMKKDAKRQARELERLQATRNELQSRGASGAEIAEYDKHISYINRDIAANTDLESYTKAKMDRIGGVDEKEAKKRAAAAMGKTDSEFNNLLNNEETKAVAKAAIEAQRRDTAQNVRKTQYARGIQEQRTLGIKMHPTGRILGALGVKKENVSAALAIRKTTEDKSNKDKLAEAAAAVAKDNEEAGGTPPPAPSGGAPGENTNPPPTPPTA